MATVADTPFRKKRESHGYWRSPTYRTWEKMKQRCQNPNLRAYRWYGGRGIKVCDRWRESFLAFLEDMGECPRGKTIDRLDNDGDYEPGNCRWATWEEQRESQRAPYSLEFLMSIVH